MPFVENMLFPTKGQTTYHKDKKTGFTVTNQPEHDDFVAKMHSRPKTALTLVGNHFSTRWHKILGTSVEKLVGQVDGTNTEFVTTPVEKEGADSALEILLLGHLLESPTLPPIGPGAKPEELAAYNPNTCIIGHATVVADMTARHHVNGRAPDGSSENEIAKLRESGGAGLQPTPARLLLQHFVETSYKSNRIFFVTGDRYLIRGTLDYLARLNQSNKVLDNSQKSVCFVFTPSYDPTYKAEGKFDKESGFNNMYRFMLELEERTKDNSKLDFAIVPLVNYAQEIITEDTGAYALSEKIEEFIMKRADAADELAASSAASASAAAPAAAAGAASESSAAEVGFELMRVILPWCTRVQNEATNKRGTEYARATAANAKAIKVTTKIPEVNLPIKWMQTWCRMLISDWGQSDDDRAEASRILRRTYVDFVGTPGFKHMNSGKFVLVNSRMHIDGGPTSGRGSGMHGGSSDGEDRVCFVGRLESGKISPDNTFEVTDIDTTISRTVAAWHVFPFSNPTPSGIKPLCLCYEESAAICAWKEKWQPGLYHPMDSAALNKQLFRQMPLPDPYDIVLKSYADGGVKVVGRLVSPATKDTRAVLVVDKAFKPGLGKCLATKYYASKSSITEEISEGAWDIRYVDSEIFKAVDDLYECPYPGRSREDLRKKCLADPDAEKTVADLFANNTAEVEDDKIREEVVKNVKALIAKVMSTENIIYKPAGWYSQKALECGFNKNACAQAFASYKVEPSADVNMTAKKFRKAFLTYIDRKAGRIPALDKLCKLGDFIKLGQDGPLVCDDMFSKNVDRKAPRPTISRTEIRRTDAKGKKMGVMEILKDHTDFDVCSPAAFDDTRGWFTAMVKVLDCTIASSRESTLRFEQEKKKILAAARKRISNRTKFSDFERKIQSELKETFDETEGACFLPGFNPADPLKEPEEFQKQLLTRQQFATLKTKCFLAEVFPQDSNTPAHLHFLKTNCVFETWCVRTVKTAEEGQSGDDKIGAILSEFGTFNAGLKSNDPPNPTTHCKESIANILRCCMPDEIWNRCFLSISNADAGHSRVTDADLNLWKDDAPETMFGVIVRRSEPIEGTPSFDDVIYSLLRREVRALQKDGEVSVTIPRPSRSRRAEKCRLKYDATSRVVAVLDDEAWYAEKIEWGKRTWDDQRALPATNFEQKGPWPWGGVTIVGDTHVMTVDDDAAPPEETSVGLRIPSTALRPSCTREIAGGRHLYSVQEKAKDGVVIVYKVMDDVVVHPGTVSARVRCKRTVMKSTTIEENYPHIYAYFQTYAAGQVVLWDEQYWGLLEASLDGGNPPHPDDNLFGPAVDKAAVILLDDDNVSSEVNNSAGWRRGYAPPNMRPTNTVSTGHV